MKIEQLIERYFDGLTTSEEEATLRRFFMSDEVPETLRIYKPLFVYFDTEIKASKTTHPRNHRYLVLWLSGVAACAAILVGLFILSLPRTECPLDGNYVMINGRCYTDEATIRSATMNSLHSVQEDGYPTSDNTPVNVMEMIENQLKDFDFLINE
jgi:hypothetical protein